MSKRIIVMLDGNPCPSTYRRIARRMMRFLNDLVRPHGAEPDLAEGYRSMAVDEAREREATEWTEAVIKDIADEPR